MITDDMNTYNIIHHLATPYYQKGRPMDLDHIDWMKTTSLYICNKENIDYSLLGPLSILHDVGYSEVPGHMKATPFKSQVRKLHMKEGKFIARNILSSIGYDKTKTEQVAYYVSVHDVWDLGVIEIYLENRVLGNFKDLDFIWMYTPKGFQHMMQLLEKDKYQLLEWLKGQTSPAWNKKPFSNPTTQALYDRYLSERIIEVEGVC